MSNDRHGRGLRRCLLASLISAALPGMAATPSSEPVTTAHIEVVGSRIKRVDYETADPVLLIERDALLKSGLMSVGEVLQVLSVHGADLNTTFNNGGDGSTRIDLRNLGNERTLVLVDGRRWVGNIDGGADLNSIPLAMIERIEVLTDGASALYGSDAIAGVVNLRTRQDLQGGESRLGVAGYGQGDGERHTAEFTYGWVGENGALGGGISHVEQDPVFAGERGISAVPTFGLPGNDIIAGASGFTANGSFGFGSRGVCPFNPAGTYPANGICSSADGRPANLNRSTYDPATGGYRLLDPRSDGYNFAPENYLLTPQERQAVFVNGRYALGETIEWQFQALYNQRRSRQQLAPNPVFFSAGLGGSNRLIIPADHVYNPFGQPVTGLGLRPGGQVRRFEQDADTLRIASGLEGSFEWASRLWIWDADLVWARNEIDNLSSGLADINRLRSALGPSFRDSAGVPRCGTAAAPIADCIPFDPFRGAGGLRQEMLDYVYFRGLDQTRVEARNLTLNLSGDAYDLPSGPLALALGYEYRDEEGASRLDPRRLAIQNLRNDSYAGAVRVHEAYLEFDVPLLADRAWAQRLDLSAATRHSRYDSFGTSNNLEAGLRWQPHAELMLRASYAEGFRAPIVSELYFPASEGVQGIQADLCAATNPTATQRANCTADGVPGGQYLSSNTVFATLSGGNDQLQPERSRSRSLGLVLSPGAWPGFDLSLDAYRIRIDDAVAPISATEVLRYCADAGIAEACARTDRDAAGNLLLVDARLLNSGFLQVEGYDLSVGYRRETPLGQFRLDWQSSYYERYELELPRGSGRRSTLGTLAPFEPGFRLRSSLDLSWQRGSWSAAAQWRYYGGLRESCITAARAGASSLCSDPDQPSPLDPAFPLNRLAARVYLDLQAAWDTPWDGQIAVGVRNALDRDPPVSYAGTFNSFDAAYRIPGRFWHLNWSQRW